jgi:Glycosyltransferase family 28 N-terminal domain
VRVLLSTWGSRGDVEPLLGLALALGGHGVDVRMCAPPDFAERVAEVGVPVVPLGFPVRELAASTPSPAEVAAALVAQHFEVIGKAAEDCDAVVATGLMPAGVRSVAEHLGIHYVLAGFHPVGIPGRGHGRASDEGPTPTVGSLSIALELALRDDTLARAGDVSTTIRTDGAFVAASKLVSMIDHVPG